MIRTTHRTLRSKQVWVVVSSIFFTKLLCILIFVVRWCFKFVLIPITHITMIDQEIKALFDEGSSTQKITDWFRNTNVKDRIALRCCWRSEISRPLYFDVAAIKKSVHNNNQKVKLWWKRFNKRRYKRMYFVGTKIVMSERVGTLSPFW
jgi:hypothetical protein